VQAGQRVLVEEGALPVDTGAVQLGADGQLLSLVGASCSTSGAARSRPRTCPTSSRATRATSTTRARGATWRRTATSGIRPVGTGWCPVLARPLDPRGPGRRLVLRRQRRSMDVSHASLRPLGHERGGGWFWIPGRTWSSAWVQWACRRATSGGARSGGTIDRWSAGAVVGRHAVRASRWTVARMDGGAEDDVRARRTNRAHAD
jgi:hypothetical protein